MRTKPWLCALQIKSDTNESRAINEALHHIHHPKGLVTRLKWHFKNAKNAYLIDEPHGSDSYIALKAPKSDYGIKSLLTEPSASSAGLSFQEVALHEGSNRTNYIIIKISNNIQCANIIKSLVVNPYGDRLKYYEYDASVVMYSGFGGDDINWPATLQNMNAHTASKGVIR